MEKFYTMPIEELAKGSNIKLDVCDNETDMYWKVAIEVLEILKKEGLLIPEDISLVCVDNSGMLVTEEAGLSTVPYPMYRLGEMAAENLIKQIKDSNFDATYEFDTDIIIRNSVRQL